MEGRRFTPVVIGVGDVINRSVETKDAVEPKELMIRAITRAFQDVGQTSNDQLLATVDSLDVVASWTWSYDDLPGLIAKGLGIHPQHTYIPDYHGGNQPAKLFDDAAKRISLGQCKVAVICGGEALASMAACAKAGQLPPPGWTKPKRNVDSVFSPTTRDLEPGPGAAHHIGAPIHIYPLYENGFRAHRGQSLQENNEESAQLYGHFATVAEKNPFAWNYGRPAETAHSIGKVSNRNRMICFPYPLLMNAFNTVNIAAACVLTSVEYAHENGIDSTKLVYPLGGAGTRDAYNFWGRPNYFSSPCISRSLDAALHVSGLTKEDIDLYDFYSCFPIVPKIACEHLGLAISSPAKPLTLLGGLTSFGGAGNNYSMHALTEMVRQLRKGNGKNGLVLANGGVITYQHVVCLSSTPRKKGPYPCAAILPEAVTDVIVPPMDLKPTGEATVETYTVDFDRNGKPTLGHVVGKLRNGSRFLANHGDESTLIQLASMVKEPIGRVGNVRQDPERKGRNLFFFVATEKL